MLDDVAFRLLWRPHSRLLDVRFPVVGRIRHMSANLIIMARTPHRPWILSAQGQVAGYPNIGWKAVQIVKRGQLLGGPVTRLVI